MPRIKPQTQQEDANLRQFGPEFQDVQCLLISEVKVLLEVQRDQKRLQGQEVQEIVGKTLEYCGRFSRFSNKQTVKEIRAYLI